MTKSVRIENADTSSYKVQVEVWDKTPDGDKLASSHVLSYPTHLESFGITSTRFLKVFEVIEPASGS